MVRAVAQIEQEIAALDQTVLAIAQAFYDAYQQYLQALGQAVRQQLVLAAYYICTNSYPEQFTQLTLSQRQTFQQALRQLARQAETELLDSLYPVASDAEPKLLASTEPEFSQGEAYDLKADLPDDLAEQLTESPGDFVNQAERQPAEDEPQAAERLHPRDIAHWQSNLEDEILQVLQTISHATNQVLQQAKILPERLPEPILEVAAKADLSSETAASPPNLLNLLIESNDDDENPGITQVVAVRLRLSEIEFGDATTAAQRSKLRHLLTQLSKLGREYQRRQKERAIAQAEAAWRASWYED